MDTDVLYKQLRHHIFAKTISATKCIGFYSMKKMKVMMILTSQKNRVYYSWKSILTILDTSPFVRNEWQSLPAALGAYKGKGVPVSKHHMKAYKGTEINLYTLTSTLVSFSVRFNPGERIPGNDLKLNWVIYRAVQPW